MVSLGSRTERNTGGVKQFGGFVEMSLTEKKVRASESKDGCSYMCIHLVIGAGPAITTTIQYERQHKRVLPVRFARNQSKQMLFQCKAHTQHTFRRIESGAAPHALHHIHSL